MKKMINRTFNQRKSMEEILFMNFERIAKEISYKHNDKSIYENYEDVLEFDYLVNKNIFGFVLRHRRINNRADFKALKEIGNSVDLSFLITDFYQLLGIKTFPVVVETYVSDLIIEYRFAIPGVNAGSDRIVNDVLTKK